MKLTLTPTPRIDRVDGVECRVWTGTDETGLEVLAWIRVVSPQTHDPEANARFEATLRALPRPRRSADGIELRFIL